MGQAAACRGEAKCGNDLCDKGAGGSPFVLAPRVVLLGEVVRGHKGGPQR